MTLPVYHLTKEDEQRKLTKEGNERASKVFDETKKDSLPDAIDYMKDHGGSLVIHKENGKFQEERTYPKSADPTSSKG